MKRKTFHFLNTSSQNNNSDKANELKRIDVPRTISLGGQEYSVADTPELANLVALSRQDAAVVEKTKLYPAIDKLKSDFEILKNAEVVDLTGNAGTVVAFIEEKMKSIETNIMSTLAPLLDANSRSQAATVEAYRNSLIEANVGKCIPELIKGETKEDIDASFAQSVELFGKYGKEFGHKTVEESLEPVKTAAAPAATTPAPAQSAATPTPAATATTPAAPVAAEVAKPETIVLPSAAANHEVASTDQPNVAGMSMEEFGNRREELEKGLKNLMATTT